MTHAVMIQFGALSWSEKSPLPSDKSYSWGLTQVSRKATLRHGLPLRNEVFLMDRTSLVRLSGFIKQHCKLSSTGDDALNVEKECINNLGRMHEL